jgi:parallel beta-helix repeat protein
VSPDLFESNDLYNLSPFTAIFHFFKERSMRTLVSALLLVSVMTLATAQTNLTGGNIAKDSVWTLAGSPYKVSGSITVNAGFTLQVDSGVVVRFQSGTYLYVTGNLTARQAIFTSSKDTVGGTPVKGDWGAIYPNNASATLGLDTCTVKFGSYGIYGSSLSSATLTGSSFLNSNSTNIYLSAPNVTLTGCTVSNSNGIGVQINNATNATLTNVTISGSTSGQGMWIGATNISITGCSVSGSSSHGIFVDHGTTASIRATTVTNSGGEGIWLGYNSHISAFIDSCTVTTAGGNGIRLYGGADSVHATTISHFVNSGIYVPAGSASIVACTITDPTKATPNPNTQFPIGLYFESGTGVNLVNSTITYTQWPAWYQGQCALVFDGNNTYANNTHMGIYINFGGTNANFALDTVALPYVFPGDFTVNSGNTMTIASTDVLKFAYGHLYVSGSLNAVAAVGQSISFTSYKDDNLPLPNSDTNADGSGTVPHQSDWYGVVFNDASVDSSSVMRRCSVTFAGAGNTGAISMYNASPTIDSCSMANNYYGAYMQYVSNPVFTNNTIGSSQLVPIAMAFTANPVFQNNIFSNSDNTFDALGLLGGTLAANAVLPIRAVLRNNTKSALGALGIDTISNVTYLMLDQVVVPPGLSLTINKGIVIKAYASNQRINVQGKLVANATPDSLIVMTSANDDNFGHPNDTNKNGNATQPGRGDWSGITFESGSDSTSLLNYCSIHYGALVYYYYYFNGIYLSGGAITTINNANPTISNCTIDQGVYGVYAYGNSKPIITGTTIVNSQYTPIAMSVPADPFFSADTFVNPGWNALGIIGENLGTSGTIKRRTVSGFTNITYVLLANLNINSGTNVVVDPGVVIKSGGPGFFVSGSLRAKGTMANGNVIFTSIHDDNFGNPGDTERNGNAAPAAAAGDWSTIRFLATSDDTLSLIDSCQINYAGQSSYGGVTYTDAGSTISNSTIFKSAAFGIRCENSSSPNVINVTLNGCTADPVAMSLQSNPSFIEPISFLANGSRGIRILEGTLSSNATLHQRSLAGITNIAYIIDNLTINAGAILTISPGVVVKFTNYYNGITVNGALSAIGTPTEKIIFTSLEDDSNGGDTNNDGNGSSPARGNWSSIDFNASSADTANFLKYCEFRYGGVYYTNAYGMVRITNANLVMDSCIVAQSSNSAIGVFGSAHPIISHVQVNNVNLTPVTMSMFSNPTFIADSALNVGYMAIGIIPETYSVTNTIPVRNFGPYNNITYLLYGTITINTGTTITIPAGVVFKDGGWVVNGALATTGTPAQPVVFTDSRDDSYGNPMDTNGDGTSTQPSISGSQRVTFNDVSFDSLSSLKNTVFRYTDGGVYLAQASPKILDCRFDQDNWGVYLTGVSNPSIDSCVFNNLKYAPIRISLVSSLASASGDVISGSTFKAIGVLEGEILVQDATLTKRNFGGITNIPYLFGNYTVANNSILTIKPGLVLKFFPLTGMTVKKGLVAVGNTQPDSVIVFTDLRDDFYGNDTNSDSTLTSPTGYSGAPYYWYPGWYGINFTNETLAPDCILRNVIIRYAGIYNSGAAITTTSASPTITYSSFNNNYSAVIANGSSNPVINYCDIAQNNTNGWGVNNVGGAFTIDATNNWWGNNTGPTNASNPGGTGQKVSTMVNFMPFLNSGAMNPLAGDVSLNGQIQAYDASLILKWGVDSTTNHLNAIQLQAADVTGNGAVSSLDASFILQYVVGLVGTFPVDSASTAAPSMVALLKSTAMAQASIDGGSVERGNQVTVNLSVSGLKGLRGADIALSYNKDQLTPVSVKATQATGSSLIESSMKNGVIRISMASSAAFDAEGALFQITFQAGDDIRGDVNSHIAFSQFTVNEKDMKSLTSDGILKIKGKPTTFGLSQNYPNPFNPSTTVSYQVPDDGQHVKIAVYSLTGQLVRTLVDADQRAGEYNVVWNGRNDFGQQVSTGIYFFRMMANNFVSVKKMLLVK